MKATNRLARRTEQEETMDYKHTPSEGSHHRIRNLFSSATGIALLCLCGCMSVTYDVRRLDQPVIFNNNPCLSRQGADSIQLTDVDHYSAEVFKLISAASSTTVSHGPIYDTYTTRTTSQSQYSDQAGINALAKIGGHSNLVIRSVSLRSGEFACNFLCAMVDSVSIKADGKVTEVKSEDPASTPAVSAPKTNGSTKP